MIGGTTGKIGAAAKQTAQMARYPAPSGGMDVRAGMAVADPNLSVYAYNLIARDYGLTVRKGYRQWASSLDNGLGVGVHSLISFDGIEENGVSNKVFGVTNEGIWDATSKSDANTAGRLVYTFTNQQANSGYGVYTQFVTDAGEESLFYADNVNGLVEYSLPLGTWSVPNISSAPSNPALDISKVAFVTMHKSKLWMVESDSDKAFYLPDGAKQGAHASAIYFGSKFPHGGNVEALYSWSVDGGNGLTDYLIVVSRSGDILVYSGDDPNVADSSTGLEPWRLVGRYFVGEVPRGNSFCAEHAGDLYILSVNGLNSMNALLQGVDSAVTNLSASNTSPSAKISSLLRREITKTIGDYGWSVSLLPAEGGILITSPTEGGKRPVQYFYALDTASWSMWRDAPIACVSSFNKITVMGSYYGDVCFMDVHADNVREDPNDPSAILQHDILWSVLTSFLPLSGEGVYKHITFIRPDILAMGQPEYVCVSRYDYNVTEAHDAGLVTRPRTDGDVWGINAADLDAAVWGTAVWAGGGQRPYNSVIGARGYGRYAAIAMQGVSRSATTIIGWDVAHTTGGAFL